MGNLRELTELLGDGTTGTETVAAQVKKGE
jgi:hypothetical protein